MANILCVAIVELWKLGNSSKSRNELSGLRHCTSIIAEFELRISSSLTAQYNTENYIFCRNSVLLTLSDAWPALSKTTELLKRVLLTLSDGWPALSKTTELLKCVLLILSDGRPALSKTTELLKRFGKFHNSIASSHIYWNCLQLQRQ